MVRAHERHQHPVDGRVRLVEGRGHLRHVGRSAPQLPDDGVDKAMKALRRYRALCETMGVDDIEVIATAAVREAKNGADFAAPYGGGKGLQAPHS